MLTENPPKVRNSCNINANYLHNVNEITLIKHSLA